MANQKHIVADNGTIDLNRVAALIDVVEARSFTAAAKARGVPKSSLSRAVTRLEQELGVVLLQRTTRKLALTEEGRSYVARAREALALLSEAREAILESDHEPRGSVRLSSVPDPNGRLLAGPLLRFLEKYPRIQLEVSLSPRFVDLVEEGFDLAVRASGKLNDSSLVVRRVGGTPQRMVAAPSYLQRRGLPKRLQDIAQHDCILFRAARGTQRWTLTSKAGPESVEVRGPLNIDDFPFVLQMCLAGAGIALVPRMLSEEHVVAGALVPVLPAYQMQAGSVYLVYPAARHLPRRVALLRDHHVEELQHQLGQCEQLLK
jgi:DNA-binding transcriptional LysR family regulator